jgi:predicted metalloendopeptidase
MINQLKYGMKELINKNNWMDAATKIVAREKVNKFFKKCKKE